MACPKIAVVTLLWQENDKDGDSLLYHRILCLSYVYAVLPERCYPLTVSHIFFMK